MDWATEALRTGLPILILIIQAIIGWVIWSLRQSFVSRADCKECRDEMGARQADFDRRTKELERGYDVQEAREAHRVTVHDLEKIYNRINALDSKISTQTGQLSSMSRDLALINQHLLETK